MYYNIAYTQYRAAILQYIRYTVVSVLPSYNIIIFAFTNHVNTFGIIIIANLLQKHPNIVQCRKESLHLQELAGSVRASRNSQ